MRDVPLLDLMKDNHGYDRTFKRYQVNFPLIAHPAEEESISPVLVRESRAGGLPGLAHNISLSGIGFVSCAYFELASLAEIEITLEAQTYFLLARIRWCRLLDLPGAALSHYGAKFLRTESVLQFIPAAARFLLAQDHDRTAEGDTAPGPERRKRQGMRP